MLEAMLAIGLLMSIPSPVLADTIEYTKSDIPNYSLTEDISTLRHVELNSTTSIADYIEARAMVHGYSPKRAVAISTAESELTVNAKNKGSTASGLFQYIDGTFLEFCIKKYKLTDTMEDKNDPHIQTECATRMLSEGGESHWEESKYGKNGWVKSKP
jgi:hypothetical protein